MDPWNAMKKRTLDRSAAQLLWNTLVFEEKRKDVRIRVHLPQNAINFLRSPVSDIPRTNNSNPHFVLLHFFNDLPVLLDGYGPRKPPPKGLQSCLRNFCAKVFVLDQLLQSI